jgi:hypothetical protein
MVLQVLREHQLYAKLSKCTFLSKKIHYLGHIVSEDGIHWIPENIEAIKSWQQPKNILEVRSFMGLVGYYRRFIAGFSKIAHSITFLQNKGIQFEWTTKCEECFQHLKDLLTIAPILKVVYLDESFVVCIDVWKEGIDGALTQYGNVICYESRKPKEHEINYATYYAELEAIVHP